MDDCINGHTSLLQKSVNVVSHRRKNFEFSSTEPHVLQDAMDVAKHTMKDSAKVIIDHGKDLSLRYQYPFIHKHATQIAGMLSLFLAVPLIGFVWWCRNSRASDSTITVNARSAQLDFAKFWLMVMVIVIHTRMIRALWSTPPSDQMMIFIKPWGTRTFAMISGIFCQKEPNSQWFESMLVRLIFPWLAYCIIIDPLLFEAASGRWQTVFVTWAHEVSKSLFVVDVGVVWFLVGLITWKLWGAVLAPLPPPLRLGAAFTWSAFAGYRHLAAFQLDKIIATFPLFVIGQLLPWKAMEMQFPGSAFKYLLGVSILVVILVLPETSEGVKAFMQEIPEFGWADRASFAEEPFFWLRGLCRNILETIKGLVFTLLCCPNSPTVFSELGKHTIYPFLLQYSMITLSQGVLEMMMDVVPTRIGPFGTVDLVVVFYATLLNIVLSSWPMRVVFGFLLEPTWLLHYMKVSEPKESPEFPTGQPSQPKPKPGVSSTRSQAQRPKSPREEQKAAQRPKSPREEPKAGASRGGAHESPPRGTPAKPKGPPPEEGAPEAGAQRVGRASQARTRQSQPKSQPKS